MSDNYIYIGCGYILNETANPVLSNTTYYINNTAVTGCNLKYQNENILAVYKNGAYDSNWTIGTTTPYGVKMASCPQANFDVNSTYSVDYVMLSTMHTTPTSIATSYQTDILSAIEDLSEVVENRQTANSSLDNLVDLSVYERVIYSSSIPVNWFTVGSTMYLGLQLSCQPKKCVPISKINNMILTRGISTGATVTTNMLTFHTMIYQSNRVVLFYKTTDTTIISDVKSYGIYCSGVDIELDCRGRI